MWRNLIYRLIQKGRILYFLPFTYIGYIEAQTTDTLYSKLNEKISLPIPAEHNILSYLNDDLLYVSSNEMLESKNTIWVVSLTKKAILTKIKLLSPITSNYSVSAFAASNEAMVFVCHDLIYFYTLKKSKATLVKTIKNPKSFLEVDFMNHNQIIVLHKLYNFHPPTKRYVVKTYTYMPKIFLKIIIFLSHMMVLPIPIKFTSGSCSNLMNLIPI